MYSSQGDMTAGETTDTDGVPHREKRRELPSIVDSLALCYMGLILLRAPISLGDLHYWAVSEAIPFIRPLRLIPNEIRRNMSTRWINLFETHHALQPGELSKSLQRLISQYQRHFSLAFPPLNHHPLLLSHIHHLALPAQLHATVDHLATLLNLTFPFPAPRTRRSTHQPLPELTLLALLTIAVKTLHPFPPTPPAYALSDTDPTLLAIDWAVWDSARVTYHAATRGDKPFAHAGAPMYASDGDAFALSPTQLDTYMSWFDRTWAEPARDPAATLSDDARRNQLPGELLDMFPVAPPPPPPLSEASSDAQAMQLPTAAEDDAALERAAAEARVEAVTRGLRTRQIVSRERAEWILADRGKEVGRVGAAYQVFKEEEELSGVAREFHVEVAERAAVSLGRLLKEVRRVEIMFEKMERKEKRDRFMVSRVEAGEKGKGVR